MKPGNEQNDVSQFGTEEQMYKGLGLDFTPTEGAPVEEPSTGAPEEPVSKPAEEPTPQEPTEQPPAAEEPSAEPSAQPEKTIFETINEQFSTEFKDEADFKSILDKANRVAELEEGLKEVEALREENLLLKEKYDPMNLFASEDSYRIAQFEKQFPDKNASVASRVFSNDFATMSDSDVVRLGILLDTPSLDNKAAEAVVERKYNIDEDGNIDAADKALMAVDAAKVRREVAALKQQITIPEKFDVSAIAQEQKDLAEQKKLALKQGWSSVAEKLVGNLPDLKFEDEVGEFNYSVTKDFPKEMVENAVQYMADAGRELSESDTKVVMDVLMNAYTSQKIHEIVKAAREDVASKLKEQFLKESHNPGTPAPDSGASKPTPKDHNDAILAGMEAMTAKRTNFLHQ